MSRQTRLGPHPGATNTDAAQPKLQFNSPEGFGLSGLEFGDSLGVAHFSVIGGEHNASAALTWHACRPGSRLSFPDKPGLHVRHSVHIETVKFKPRMHVSRMLMRRFAYLERAVVPLLSLLHSQLQGR